MKFKDYRPETKSLLAALEAAGFTLQFGCNGGARFYADRMSRGEFVSELTAADDAYLTVAPQGDARGYVIFLVYGNNPGELVCDYAIHPLLEQVINAEADKWEGRDQPMEEANA